MAAGTSGGTSGGGDDGGGRSLMAVGMLEFLEIVKIYERESKTVHESQPARSSIGATNCPDCSVRVEDLIQVVALVGPYTGMDLGIGT